MCCRKAMCGFVTSGFWQIDPALLNWPWVGSYWQWAPRSRSLHVPTNAHRPGTAPIAAPPWSYARDSPPRNSRGAATSIRPNAATSCGPATCLWHASGLVCPLAVHSVTHRHNDARPRFAFITFRTMHPCFRRPSAGPRPGSAVPKRPSIPIAAASAANASGFLLVSLSKTPRSGVHVFAPAVVRRGVSDQG